MVSKAFREEKIEREKVLVIIIISNGLYEISVQNLSSQFSNIHKMIHRNNVTDVEKYSFLFQRKYRLYFWGNTQRMRAFLVFSNFIFKR